MVLISSSILSSIQNWLNPSLVSLLMETLVEIQRLVAMIIWLARIQHRQTLAMITDEAMTSQSPQKCIYCLHQTKKARLMVKTHYYDHKKKHQ
jgi:hypothetical protein